MPIASVVDEVTERLASGEFHRPTNVTVVCDCVGDSRSDAAHGVLHSNSAGGSESLMVADDLTAKRFAKDTDGSTLAQYKATLAFLHESGQQLVVILPGATAPGSGCGANDKLSAIYGFMAANGDALRDMAATLGVQVDNATQELIIGNATARTEFANGIDLLDILQAQPDAHTALLQGKHREVVAVITRPGTTLDREALRAEFPDHQAFNLDAWALSNTARLLTKVYRGYSDGRVRWCTTILRQPAYWL